MSSGQALHFIYPSFRFLHQGPGTGECVYCLHWWVVSNISGSNCVASALAFILCNWETRSPRVLVTFSLLWKRMLQKQFRKKGFVLAHSLRQQSIMMHHGREEAAVVRKHRETDAEAYLPSSRLSQNSRPCMVPPTYRMSLPISVNSLSKLHHRYTQRFVS